MNIVSEFDDSKYYLGKLCKRGHNWNDTNKSLRFSISGNCRECQNLTRTERRRKNGMKARIGNRHYDELLRILSTTNFDDECFNWQGRLNPYGYGIVKASGKNLTTHRLALEFKLSRAIKEGMFACHHCDNRRCINPLHIYEGTQQDNNNDRKTRNRESYFLLLGDSNPFSKLKESQVKEIRKLYAQGETCRELAQKYCVSYDTIYAVVTRKNWRHIP